MRHVNLFELIIVLLMCVKSVSCSINESWPEWTSCLTFVDITDASTRARWISCAADLVDL
jgi:hypothetical protein